MVWTNKHNTIFEHMTKHMHKDCIDKGYGLETLGLGNKFIDQQYELLMTKNHEILRAAKQSTIDFLHSVATGEFKIGMMDKSNMSANIADGFIYNMDGELLFHHDW
jgi:hypothetical protein